MLSLFAVVLNAVTNLKHKKKKKLPPCSLAWSTSGFFFRENKEFVFHIYWLAYVSRSSIHVVFFFVHIEYIRDNLNEN